MTNMTKKDNKSSNTIIGTVNHFVQSSNFTEKKHVKCIICDNFFIGCTIFGVSSQK